MTHQISHLKHTEPRTKTDSMSPYHLPLQERATRAHPPKLNGHMIKVQKSIHKSEATFTWQLCGSKRSVISESPNRKKTKAASSDDLLPPRRRVRKGKNSDSDQSPPRRRPHGRRGSDLDLSPPRKRGQGGRGSDSDLSPPRKRSQGRRGSDSDLSPPRRTRSPDGQAVSSGFMFEDPLYQWS